MSSTDELLATLEGVETGSFTNETERVLVRDALHKALRKTQSPWDLAWEHSWVYSAVSASINTLVQAGVFTKWAEAGFEPITSAELAGLTGADVVLLRRMLHCLACQHLIVEAGRDTFAATPWARSFVAEPDFANVYGGFHGELMGPVCEALPGFLKETGYVNPTNVDKACFQYWKGVDVNFFEWLAGDQRLIADFSSAMKLVRISSGPLQLSAVLEHDNRRLTDASQHSKYNLVHWTDVYPTENVISAGRQRPDRKLVVDIGGNKGHDILKFYTKHQGSCPPSSLVLQDLPDTLRGVDLGTDAVELQPHNFFDEQPVRGARVYFMHIVLHDWPDDKAAQILGNIAAAMERGYSRLLLQESLLADDRPLAKVTVLDIIMMAGHCSAERSETQWAGLLAGVGLKIVKIWKPLGSIENIIEAQLV